MVDLFVPEAKWAPRSWGLNHPLTVRAQILHGLVDAGYGYWGFSPANVPEGGYAVYGVDAIGPGSRRQPVQQRQDARRPRLPGLPDREPQPDPPASAYTNGVVTPHAAFLALPYARELGAREPSPARADPGDVRPLGLP